MQNFIIQGRMQLPLVWRRASIFFGGMGLVALALVEFIAPNDWYMLGLVCGTALVYAIILLYFGFRDGGKRLLTDPFLILVAAFSLYYLCGTLLLVIGPEDQANYVLKWYITTAQDALRITAMNLIGLAVLLFAASFFNGLRIEKVVQPTIIIFNRMPTQKIFWLFFIVGFSAFLWVETTDGVVNGTIGQLSKLILIAVLVGIIYRGRNAAFLHGLAILIALFASIMGLLSFGKLATLQPLLIFLLGLYLRLQNTKMLVVLFAIMIAALILLSKPIGEARVLLMSSSDTSLLARFDILQQVFMTTTDDSNHGGMWSRLCYTTSQVAAVDLYEKGQGGNDVELLGWVFLPRAIFPNKPIITRSGVEFNVKVTGFDTSSTGMGLFVSGYYNLGWLGLIFASILAGWILAIFAAISRSVISSSSVILLPVGLLGSFMAFRIDGHFVADYLGPFAMIIIPLLIFSFILRTGSLRTISRASSG
ncbi:MAG: hypothetical protein P9F19_14170 [Candidatus Contendobacter sp.]|nr:hypothetical protein [Candidatus Contendobacter sp.]MDG4558518.1 hypothetical protein [Candidatus Contendobacter sp.]